MEPTDDMSGQDLLEGGIAGEITEYDWQQAEKVAVRLLEIAEAESSIESSQALMHQLPNDRMKAHVLQAIRELNQRNRNKLATLYHKSIALQFRAQDSNRRGV